MKTAATPVTALSILGSGAATFSSSVSVGAGMSIGTTGTNNINWFTSGGIRLSRTNVGPEDSLTQRWTGTLAYVEIAASSQWNGGVTILPNGGGNVLIGTTTDAGFKLNVNGTGRFLNNLYVNSSTYPTNYSTSLRSDGSANGILQLGNNNINYILAGNTAAGGFLSIRVNVSTESISSGTEALRLNSNATATFSSSVTATSFFESSDATIKTLVEDNYQAKGIESVVAKLYIKNGKQELGYFAQDLEDILPSAVNKDSDGLLNLSYREVHTAKIAALEKEITELKKQLKNN
jgi:hypothetical protein